MTEIKITKKIHPEWWKIQDQIDTGKPFLDFEGIQKNIGKFMYEYKKDKQNIILIEINDGRANKFVLIDFGDSRSQKILQTTFRTFEEGDKKIKEILNIDN